MKVFDLHGLLSKQFPCAAYRKVDYDACAVFRVLDYRQEPVKKTEALT
jgi:hypothetical protein